MKNCLGRLTQRNYPSHMMLWICRGECVGSEKRFTRRPFLLSFDCERMWNVCSIMIMMVELSKSTIRSICPVCLVFAHIHTHYLASRLVGSLRQLSCVMSRSISRSISLESSLAVIINQCVAGGWCWWRFKEVLYIFICHGNDLSGGSDT